MNRNVEPARYPAPSREECPPDALGTRNFSNSAGGDAQTLACPAPTWIATRSLAFYSRSARPLWAYLARVSPIPALADDLMQESFVRFLCASRPDDGEVAARRYLFRIATNLLRDHWRRPRHASIEELPEEFFAAEVHLRPGRLASHPRPRMAQMRPRDRQLLWLAYAEGYSHREIAEVTGLAAPASACLLFRARRKMARLLRNQTSNNGGQP